MSPVREKFVKIVENLHYDIEKEILERDEREIIQEITAAYVEAYGTEDLSEQDKDCIRLILDENNQGKESE